MVRALSHVLFYFNPGPVWRVPIPNRYTAKAKLCFCKNNKRRIIKGIEDEPNSEVNTSGHTSRQNGWWK